jgi:hypothetical protein
MEHKRHELHSFKDLLCLEDDQVERLSAELPGMIKKAKAFMELLNACGEVAEAPTPFAELLSPLVWLDDGKTDLTMSLIDGEKEYLRYEKNGS